MSVSFYDFNNLHHEEFKKEILSRITDIVNEGSFIDSKYNASFEKRFAEIQNAKHCLLVGNGTDALEIALLAYGIKSGDKVGVPGITFYATAEAVLNIGAIPVYIDTDLKTGLMDPQSLKRVTETHKLSAVIPVHIYGLPAPILEIEKICDPLEIKIVEDAAQAQGGSYVDGGPIGSSKNLTTFSFYPTKNLSAFGDAGCILTQDDNLKEEIITIRNHGRGNSNRLGRNSRCDHVQAAVLDLKLDEIKKLNQQRKEVASNYLNELKGIQEIEILDGKFINCSSWHLFPIKVKDEKIRKELQAFLADKKIGNTPFYERTLSQEKSLGGYEGENENSLNLAGRVICLPMHPFLSKEDISFVSTAIKEYFNT